MRHDLQRFINSSKRSYCCYFFRFFLIISSRSLTLISRLGRFEFGVYCSMRAFKHTARDTTPGKLLNYLCVLCPCSDENVIYNISFLMSVFLLHFHRSSSFFLFLLGSQYFALSRARSHISPTSR